MKLKDYMKSTLKNDPKFRGEYKELAQQYELINSIIATRLERKMTQADLAERAGLRKCRISRFECGKYVPTVEFLQKVALALDRELDIRMN